MESPKTGNKAITALLPLPDGRLLAGTRNGLVTLGGDGSEQGWELPGLRITSLSAGGGRLWVGIWKNGIRVRSDQGWTSVDTAAGLPANSVSDLAVGITAELWVALYGEGVSRMPMELIVE